MNTSRPSRLPMYANDCGCVAQTIAELGVSTQAIEAWLRIFEVIRSFCFSRGIITHWPLPIIYATPGEALLDQIHPHSQTGDFTHRVHRVRGWAVFGSFHHFALPEWNNADRCVLHARLMGGHLPITNVLMHEIGHHHLFQKQGLAYEDHLNDAVEERIDRICTRWITQVAPEVQSLETPHLFRAIDLMTG